jgi:diamine N-acetyltransferase
VIRLRKASSDDLDFISRLEKRFASLGYVGSDSDQLHKQRMEGPDSAYLVIERLGEPVGFVILCGLNSINRSIELKRVAVSEPGCGTGREALRQVMRMAFSELSAHRLWLDVYSDNQRALRTYRALGFMEEGTMRECIWHGGKFRSLVLMSLLEQDFKPLLASPTIGYDHRGSVAETLRLRRQRA